MRTFHDSTGRAWPLAVNVGAMGRVKGSTGVNLYTVVDDGFEGLTDLFADPCLFIDVIFAVVKPEAERLGVEHDAFLAAVPDEEAIDRIKPMFMEELADFFSEPKKSALRKMLAAWTRLQAAVKEKGTAQVAAIDVESEVEKYLASFGNSPESSASTPDPSPSPS